MIYGTLSIAYWLESIYWFWVEKSKWDIDFSNQYFNEKNDCFDHMKSIEKSIFQVLQRSHFSRKNRDFCFSHGWNMIFPKGYFGPFQSLAKAFSKASLLKCIFQCILTLSNAYSLSQDFWTLCHLPGIYAFSKAF